MKRAIILVVISIIGFSSCGKYNDAKFYYKETYCADPWGNNSTRLSNADLEKLVSSYLTDSIKIKISNCQVTNEGEIENCYACSCKTGRYVRIDADESYTNVLNDLRFILDSE